MAPIKASKRLPLMFSPKLPWLPFCIKSVSLSFSPKGLDFFGLQF
jgi:hypothetical protein